MKTILVLIAAFALAACATGPVVDYVGGAVVPVGTALHDGSAEAPGDN
jgi:hypothetical protein